MSVERWTLWPCPKCGEVLASDPDDSGCDHIADDHGSPGPALRMAEPVEVVPVSSERLRVLRITDEMVERAAEAYEFGVMPGDESEATMDEKRSMARRVLAAAFGEPRQPSA